MASIRGVVSHERGEVRAEWSGFFVCTRDKTGRNQSKTNRFTKSSLCSLYRSDVSNLFSFVTYFLFVSPTHSPHRIVSWSACLHTKS